MQIFHYFSKGILSKMSTGGGQLVNNRQNLGNVVCERPLKECKGIIVQTKQEQILIQNNKFCFIFYQCIKKQSEALFSYKFVQIQLIVNFLYFVYKVFLVIKKNFRSRRPTICEIFEITRTFYSNSEWSEQFLKYIDLFFTCYQSFFRPYTLGQLK